MFVKTLLVKVLLSVCAGSVVYAQGVAPKYPAVKSWSGQAWVTGKDGKRQLINRSQILREKAFLETSVTGELEIDLDKDRSFTLLGGTEVSLPVISWEGGAAPVVLLKKGDLHWKQPGKDKVDYNVALRSDLFEFLAVPGDYTLWVRPDKANTGVKVYAGGIEFSALNGEESVFVKPGQQVSFQGVLEGGEIAYDVLLKGKRIPKGRLTAISNIDPAELQKAEVLKKKQAAEVAKAAARKKAALTQAQRDGLICSAPGAKFNECAWVCVGNPKSEKKNCLVAQSGVSCVRKRCNANGTWADEQTYDAEKGGILCKAQAVIGPCDY